jgi:hypothetical protein
MPHCQDYLLQDDLPVISWTVFTGGIGESKSVSQIGTSGSRRPAQSNAPGG